MNSIAVTVGTLLTLSVVALGITLLLLYIGGPGYVLLFLIVMYSLFLLTIFNARMSNATRWLLGMHTFEPLRKSLAGASKSTKISLMIVLLQPLLVKIGILIWWVIAGGYF